MRRRLLDALDHGVRDGVVVLRAPAGYGKSVLLASWLSDRTLPGPPRRLSLERSHNDLPSLLSELLRALRGPLAVAPSRAPRRLPPPDSPPPERLLASLGAALAELTSPLLLVLDDLHNITSPSAASALDFLLRRAPPALRIVLAGRAFPPLPFERLRVAGALTELRAADLAFDRAETANLCRLLSVPLSDAALDLLWTRTEGWPAVVRLTALALRSRPDPLAFLDSLSGTDPVVAEYLASEVLSPLPPAALSFVSRTSLVASFTPDLAFALSGSPDARAPAGSSGVPAPTGSSGAPVPAGPSDAPALPDSRDACCLTPSAVERLGVPLFPADTECLRLRCHPLLADLLQADLRRSRPSEIPDLHRRAACWYAAHSEVAPAIFHALAGDAWEQAAPLIAEHWLDLFLSGDSAVIRALAARLPPDLLASDPRLSAAAAGGLLEEGDLSEASRRLALARAAHDRLPSSERRAADLYVAAVALHHARLRVNLRDASRFARILTDSPAPSSQPLRASLRAFSLCSVGAVLLWSGSDLAAAADSLHEALALACEAGQDVIAADCRAHLALVALLRGELSRASSLGAEALPAVERHSLSVGPATACAHLAAAACSYRRGEFERARTLLSRASAAAAAAEAPLRLSVALLEAAVLAAAGPSSAARGALKLRAIRSELSGRPPVPAPDFLRLSLDSAEPRILAAAGDLAGAADSLAAARERSPSRLSLLVRQVSLDLLTGSPSGTADLLAAALDGADARGRAGGAAAQTTGSGGVHTAGAGGADSVRTGAADSAWADADGTHPATLLEGRLLQALSLHASGDSDAASAALDRALAVAEREPYRDAFLLNGPSIRELLEVVARSGTAHPALVEVLLDALHHRAPPPPAPAQPLTEREQRILRYLPTLLSNAEIASEMFVSLNTVKTHLRSIYRKLDATSRAEAVDRARRLGLLPAGIRRPRIVRRV